MALTATSKTANLIKSLNVYTVASLVTASSLQVHFPDRPGLFSPSGARWVRVDYILGISRIYHGTIDDALNTGNLVRGIINLNCCELIQSRTDPYALHALKDTVHGYYTEGTVITIRDYDTSGNPIVGKFVVLDVSESQVQDGLGTGENGIAILNLSAEGEYLEGFS